MKDQEAIAINFRSQIIIPKSLQEDLVEGLYQINIGDPVHELNNEFCRYYKATNIENEQEYFAIVFEKNFIPNLDIFQILKTSNFEGLNKLITYSIVKISYTKSYNLVAIVEQYNFKNSLANHLEQYDPLSVDQIENRFISSFTTLISQCERMNIPCGNIHPSNIIMLDDGQFLLREPIISYPHFYQTGCYVAPELVECTEAGRSIYGVAADIYSLGVTVFYALTGKQPWIDYENAYTFNEDRFEHTTFRLLVGKRKISEHFRVFFKWVLNDNAAARWQTRNIFEWLSGYIPKASLFEKISENTNLISFNGRNYSNLKSIAYAMFNNWDEALQFVDDDRLLKWVQRHNVSSAITEELQELLGSEKSNKVFAHGNERTWKLTKLLSVIDPHGGIRQEGIAISAASIPVVIHYLHARNRRSAIDQIVRVIKERYWQVSDNKLSAMNVNTNLDAELKNISKFFALVSPIFGLERVVYSLNFYAICFSPIVVNEHVINLSELLITLNAIAAQIPDKFHIDRHIIAFIAAKISLRQEADIKILSNFPKFSEHHLIYGLCILSVAQQHEPDIKIADLCKVITVKVVELFNEHLHNIQFKQKLAATLTEDATTGDLSKIVSRLNNQTEFINDYNGYYNACKEVQRLKNQMQFLQLEDRIFDRAIFLGQKLTVLVSYVLCFIVTVILII
ncbi:protein kinase domain-containing protein [Candidatus Trichorickettsia mobilis]|uniref:protein kinase domain-containing protein n=1 Tax=Candidatus Trichorickettsia mobilis TaxID=1346319 RepID=UPI00292EF75C|nr:hypothetical protein [Candidatus Trichorickettsia mobilis]